MTFHRHAKNYTLATHKIVLQKRDSKHVGSNSTHFVSTCTLSKQTLLNGRGTPVGSLPTLKDPPSRGRTSANVYTPKLSTI